jgi:hypothetical protein
VCVWRLGKVIQQQMAGRDIGDDICAYETDAMDGRSGQKDNLLVLWSNEIGYAN